MTAIRSLQAFVGAFALVMAGAAYAGQALPTPGITGPWLGDPNTNLSTIVNGLQNNITQNFNSYTTLTVAAGPTTSTQMQYGLNFLTAASGTTASVVLPVAKAGADLSIANNTGQGLQIWPATATQGALGAGGTDYINGTGSGSFYGNTTNGKTVQCLAVQAGNWWCASGS